MTDAGEGIRVSAASASRSLEVRHNARPCWNCLMEEINQKKKSDNNIIYIVKTARMPQLSVASSTSRACCMLNYGHKHSNHMKDIKPFMNLWMHAPRFVKKLHSNMHDQVYRVTKHTHLAVYKIRFRTVCCLACNSLAHFKLIWAQVSELNYWCAILN